MICWIACSFYGVALVILVLRFGPHLYFTEDSHSQQDFDDEDDSLLDWDSATDDSSQDLSHIEEHDDEDNIKHAHESTIWGSMNETACYVNVESKEVKRAESSLSRHASAPNVMMMTYEVPLADSEGMKDEPKQRGKRSPKRGNKLKLSFHG